VGLCTAVQFFSEALILENWIWLFLCVLGAFA